MNGAFWLRPCRYGDHYEWNKVVTCIHNVLSQQRWLENYGEVTIHNLNSTVCTCKLTFIKVSPASQKPQGGLQNNVRNRERPSRNVLEPETFFNVTRTIYTEGVMS